MSIYFPLPQKVTMGTKIESLIYNIGNVNQTKIIISTLLPGAKLETHSHPEVQMGVAIQGSFAMNVNGIEKNLEPMSMAYATKPNMNHSAENHSNEVAIGLDIKCLNPTIVKDNDEVFLSLGKKLTLSTGIKMQFLVSPWCEIMISEIPPGAKMPIHDHQNEQIGIVVSGKYLMRVGNEEEIFSNKQVYYTPPNVPHGAYNPFSEMAIALNIFVPTRYNRPPKHERRRV